jgi:hypothetical protein
MRIWQGITLFGETVFGLNSTIATPTTLQRVWGSVSAKSGDRNPQAVSMTVFGPAAPYHSIEGRAGSPNENEFAENADHFHYKLWNFRNTGTDLNGVARLNPMPEKRQFAQLIYTAGDPQNLTTSAQNTSLCVHSGAIPAAGAALANEVSIDTTAVGTPTAPSFSGVVTFRVSSNPNVLAGQQYLVRITGTTVAGIQAAIYYASVNTASASVGGGQWEFKLNVTGLDPVHWTPALSGVSTQVANFDVFPFSSTLTLATTQVASPAVSGDPSLLDITLASTPPAYLGIGHVLSFLPLTTSSIGTITKGIMYPGTVVKITGNVVRVRLGEARFRQNAPTVTGSDTTPANYVVAAGVRDWQHEIPIGYQLVSQYRNGDGLVTCNVFGSVALGASVVRSCGVGMNLYIGTSDTWRAGTDNDDNAMTLQGNVLSVPTGVNIGASQIRTGTGSPEAVVTAPRGSLYLRTDGGAGTTLYVKESGTGNTGWIAK